MPPLRADGGGGADEQLGIGRRRDDRADIAPVEDRAAGPRGKIALALDQRGPHRRVGRDDRGRGPRLFGSQRRIGQQRIGKAASRQRITGIGRIAAFLRHARAHRPVKQARIEIGQRIMGRERAGDGALARCGRAVDGNNHAVSPSWRRSQASS